MRDLVLAIEPRTESPDGADLSVSAPGFTRFACDRAGGGDSCSSLDGRRHRGDSSSTQRLFGHRVGQPRSAGTARPVVVAEQDGWFVQSANGETIVGWRPDPSGTDWVELHIPADLSASSERIIAAVRVER